MASENAQDLRLTSDGSGLYDINISTSEADFDSVGGFESSDIVSLFTDARAPSSIIGEDIKRRGWIGDILTTAQQRKLGSILWVYDESRLTQKTVNSVRLETKNAFEWVIEDNVVKNVNVDVEKSDRGLTVNIEHIAYNNSIRRFQSILRRTGEI